jgi:hypothetical protein
VKDKYLTPEEVISVTSRHGRNSQKIILDQLGITCAQIGRKIIVPRASVNKILGEGWDEDDKTN